MADEQDNNTPTVSGNVMFYEKPVPLTKDKHTNDGTGIWRSRSLYADHFCG